MTPAGFVTSTSVARCLPSGAQVVNPGLVGAMTSSNGSPRGKLKLLIWLTGPPLIVPTICRLESTQECAFAVGVVPQTWLSTDGGVPAGVIPLEATQPERMVALSTAHPRAN